MALTAACSTLMPRDPTPAGAAALTNEPPGACVRSRGPGVVRVVQRPAMGRAGQAAFFFVADGLGFGLLASLLITPAATFASAAPKGWGMPVVSLAYGSTSTIA